MNFEIEYEYLDKGDTQTGLYKTTASTHHEAVMQFERFAELQAIIEANVMAVYEIQRKRIKRAECYDCGLEYGSTGWIDAYVTNEVWQMIAPDKPMDGILCINCMSKRLEIIGLKNVEVMLGSGAFKAIPYESFDINKRGAWQKFNDSEGSDVDERLSTQCLAFVKFLVSEDTNDDDKLTVYCKALGIEPQLWGESEDINYTATYENMAKALLDKYGD